MSFNQNGFTWDTRKCGNRVSLTEEEREQCDNEYQECMDDFDYNIDTTYAHQRKQDRDQSNKARTKTDRENEGLNIQRKSWEYWDAENKKSSLQKLGDRAYRHANKIYKDVTTRGPYKENDTLYNHLNGDGWNNWAHKHSLGWVGQKVEQKVEPESVSESDTEREITNSKGGYNRHSRKKRSKKSRSRSKRSRSKRSRSKRSRN